MTWITLPKLPPAARNLFLLLFICSFHIYAAGTTDISGYFENRFFLIENPTISRHQLQDKLSLGDYNRMRLKLQASPSEKVTVNLAVDFFTFHGIMTSPLGTYDPANTGNGNGTDSGEDNKRTFEINLDRAYVDLYFKHFDLSIGKQRVALGVSYLWAPLDIFNRINFLEPKEEKPGTNAAKLYIPLGSASSLTAVFSPEEKFNTSRSAFRAKTRLLGIDMALTLADLGSEEITLYGLDLRGENFIGWWLEGGYFTLPGQKITKVVFGFDYTFGIGRGIYWLNEFFYDDSGANDPADYDYEQLLAGKRFTMGRKYCFSMLSYPFSDFLSGSIAYIANWGDGSYILNPGLRYDISQNVQIASGFYLPLGKSSGEFKKERPNIFFIWLKINF